MAILAQLGMGYGRPWSVDVTFLIIISPVLLLLAGIVVVAGDQILWLARRAIARILKPRRRRPRDK